jgi:uncharacterized protein
VILTGLAAVAVLAGAVVRGYAGFGASMFWVASLSLIYAPAGVIPSVLALEVLASLVLLPAVAASVEWRSMSWMLAATLVTMPAGVLLLSTLPARPMRLVVAVAILVGTLATAWGADLAGGRGRRTALTAGAISGVVNGSTGVGGPPAVLLYFSPSTEAAVGRATLIAYFLATDSAGFGYMALGGLVDRTVLLHTALFAPVALVGITAGQWLFQRHGARGFRRVVISVLLLLSVAMLLRAFTS